MQASIVFAMSRIPALLLMTLVVLLASSQAVQCQSKRYALIIGVNKYENSYDIPDLRFAVADAVALKNVLEARSFTVKILTEEQATTRNSIVKSLNKYARELTPNDEFILFFAGHGARQEINGKTYWLASDADIDELDVNGIRLDHLMDYVNDIPAKNKLVLLDHCYAGDVQFRPSETVSAGGGGGGGLGSSDGAIIDRGVFRVDAVRTELTRERNVTLIAGARNEAYEDSTLGHGVFTQTLLEAFGEGEADGFGEGTLDDKVKVSELIAYTRSRMFQLVDTTALAARGLMQEVISRSVSTNSADFDVLNLPTEHISQDDIERFLRVLGRWNGVGVLSVGAMEASVLVLMKKKEGDALSDKEKSILRTIQQWVPASDDDIRDSAGISLGFAIEGLLSSP